MEAQLRRIIEGQAEQNQLLKYQLRWLKCSLLTLMLLATGSIGCLSVLIHKSSTTDSNLAVLKAAPLREYPMPTEDDAIHFPPPKETISGFEVSRRGEPFFDHEISVVNGDIALTPFGKRIAVPPMAKPPIALHFSSVETIEDRPRRGCDGMCM